MATSKMNITKEDAENLDKILVWSLANKDQSDVNIQKEIIPGVSQTKAEFYIGMLTAYNPQILTNLPIEEDEFIIRPTDYTQEFLNSGGYTKLFDDQQYKQQIEEDDKELSRESLKTAIAASKQANVIANKARKEARTAIWLAALLTFLVEIIKWYFFERK